MSESVCPKCDKRLSLKRRYKETVTIEPGKKYGVRHFKVLECRTGDYAFEGREWHFREITAAK